MTDWGKRAAAILDELSKCSQPGPGVTRLPFTLQHRMALDVLTSCMKAAGLSVSLDDAGTLIGRLEGPPGTGTFLMGSHQDSVRQGGAFDGIMGVVLPILALERLQQDSVELPFAVEVLAFADEEGVRFPTALIGSRALAGAHDAAVLDMTDADGVTMRQAMEAFGLSPGGIASLNRDPKEVIGFLETHIEQGPILESNDRAVGVVTAICGIERHQICITGETGHAGTLPMAARRDALVGAAAIVSEVNRMGMGTQDMRATVGALYVVPNMVNAVPGVVRLTAELRSSQDAIRREAGESLHRFAQQISADTGLKIECDKSYCQVAQPCAPELSADLENAVIQSEMPSMSLASGATHDASAMAKLCPVAMLFVRCREGVSHRPEEFASPKDMGAAVRVLAAFLASRR